MLKQDWNRKVILLETVDDEGYETEIAIKAHAVVCHRCGGEGKHDHPAFSNGITSDEWDQWGEDDRENYRSGAYDVTCTVCNGRNVVLEADENDPNLKLLHEWMDEEAAYRRECEMERRMGA